MTTNPPAPKRFSSYLAPDLRRRLKTYAASQDLAVWMVLTDALTSYLDRVEKKPKRRR